MDARTHTQWTSAPASSNGLLHGNILLSTSSLSEPSTPISSVQAQNMGEGAQQLDQLESQIKALRQQALGTQNTLQQMKGRDAHQLPFDLVSDAPWVLGVEGLVVGLGALVMGGVLGWYAWRRPVTRSPSVEGDFADSQQYLDEDDREPQLGIFKTPEVPAVASAPVHEFTRNFPEVVDFVHSAPMAESESVLNLFWDEEKPPLPESEPEPAQDLLNPVPSADASPFAPPSPSLEFDPEVAASEVERVRKSLADKRDARARQRMYDEWPRDSLQPALASEMPEQEEAPAGDAVPVDGPADGPVFTALVEQEEVLPGAAVDLALDLDLDLDLGTDSQGAPESEPDLMVQAMKDLGQHSAEPADVPPPSDAPVQELALESASDTHEDWHNDESMVEFEFTPLAETPDTVPNPDLVEPIQAMEADVDVDAPVGPDPAVQLELAQEFLALGLLQGARELALEVLEGSDADLQSQAQALIDQLDTVETAQRVGALIDAPAAL